jgi:hypothetical protein
MIDDKSSTVQEVDRKRQGRLRRGQFGLCRLMLVIAFVAIWVSVLFDQHIGPLVLLVLGTFGVVLAVMGMAMGLGLLGFGVYSACDRAVGWLHRASQWPDE